MAALVGVGGLGEGVGYPMLSVPWWVSLANLGGSISRPTGFSADPLLQCSNTKTEGDIWIPISPLSLPHLILNLDGYYFTPSRVAVTKNMDNSKCRQGSGELEPSNTVDGNGKWWICFGKEFGSFSKN